MIVAASQLPLTEISQRAQNRRIEETRPHRVETGEVQMEKSRLSLPLYASKESRLY